MSNAKSIYFLPGRGGRLDHGLGAELHARGFNISGRELVDQFQRLPFRDQVAMVADDLKTEHWRENAKVIANSFGAYLFLHAQAVIEPFIGRVLLLSPIIGEASNEEQMMFFVPPLARHFEHVVQNSLYPIPRCCEIHVGEYDWQSNPSKVTNLARSLNMSVSVVPKNGHKLDYSYVEGVLNRWLIEPP